MSIFGWVFLGVQLTLGQDQLPPAAPVYFGSLLSTDPRIGVDRSPISEDPSTFKHLKRYSQIHQKRQAIGRAISKILGAPVISAIELADANRYLSYEELLQNLSGVLPGLDVHRDRYVPTRENGPVFVNSNAEFEGVSDKEFGYCWGLATLVRNFTVLAFYTDLANYQVEVPSRSKHPKRWVAYYQKKIQQIANGDPTIIPGFKNLREFSNVPEFEFEMKIQAAKLWANRAIRIKNRSVYVGSRDRMTPKETDALISDLEARLARGEFPKILFTNENSATGPMGIVVYIHASMVYRVEHRTDGRVRLYLWDINFYTESLQKSERFIEIEKQTNGNYVYYYAPWAHLDRLSKSGRLGKVRLSPEENLEVAKFVGGLSEFCLDHRELCNSR